MTTELTCGDCKLIQDCGIRDMNHKACNRIVPWEKTDASDFIPLGSDKMYISWEATM